MNGLKELRQEILEKRYSRDETLTLKKICKISGIKLPGELKAYGDQVIDNIAMSVHQVTPGCLLFHRAKKELEERDISKIRENCFCVITSDPIEGCKNIIAADDGENYYRIFRYIKNLHKAKVVAVTGSIGKTSTKEMIEAVLAEKYGETMLASIGNSNSRIRVARNIMRLNQGTEVYLQEVGAGSGDEDIVRSSAVMLNADAVVYTNIKDSHIEYYGSRKNIAREKFTLSDYGKKDGLALINYDDEILRNHKFKQRRLTYALSDPKADYYAKDIKMTGKSTAFSIVDRAAGTELPVKLKVIGEHHVLNAVVAYAVGRYLNADAETIAAGLMNYKPSRDRQNLINLGKYKVLADCYNSSYDAIKAILKTVELLKTKNNGRKIAVIGDIFELGDISEETHRKVGKLLSEANLDQIIFQGGEAKYAYETCKKACDSAIYCTDREEMIDTVKEIIREDDLILFKASHGMNFSGAIDTLFGTDIGETSSMGHKEYAAEKDGDFLYYVFEYHATVKEYYGQESKVVLPEAFSGLPVEKLGKSVFKDSSTIEEAVLPDSMVRLRGYCFKNSSLKSVTFGKNLKQIGAGTFRMCKNLEKAALPEGLLLIGHKAFAECENLKEIYIPESVKRISKTAFSGSENTVILCEKDSYAERYAEKNGMQCRTAK